MDTKDLDILIEQCLNEPISPDSIESLCAAGSIDVMDFCDGFSRRVAERYASRLLSFEIADAAMNELYTYVLMKYDVILPPFSWNVYLAFDEGEYRHSRDGDNVDPEEKYTRPQILALISPTRGTLA